MSAQTAFIRTARCPAYSADRGSARCRVSVDLAKRHRLQINSIVRVQLLPSRQEVLCTVWPDTYQVLGPVPSSSSPTGEGQPVHDMCIDDSITKGPNAGDDRLCQILDVFPPRSVSSYYLDLSPLSAAPIEESGQETESGEETDSDPASIGPMLFGYPLAKGFRVALGGYTVECQYVSPSGVCLVRPPSMLLRAPPDSVQAAHPVDSTTSAPLSGPRGEEVAVTEPLQLIIDSVVRPVQYLHQQAFVVARGVAQDTEDREQPSVESSPLPEKYRSPAAGTPSKGSAGDKADKAYQHMVSSQFNVISGLLLTGPPGVGKTYSLKALQSMSFPGCTVKVREIKLRDILTSDDGIAELMQVLGSFLAPSAVSSLQCEDTAALTLVLLDEADSLGRGDADTENQHLIKHYLCKWMDNMHSSAPLNKNNYFVFVATTNRPDDVDAQLRTGSRLAKEVNFLNSSLADKEKLFCTMLSGHSDVLSRFNVSPADVHRIGSRVTPRLGGYAAADISVLVSDSLRALCGLQFSDSGSGALEKCIEEAYGRITPSCLRSNVLSVPPISYEDVIGHEEAKRCFRRALSFYEESAGGDYKHFGLTAPGGILLYGPPGNSKTRLVMAAAHSHGLPVISLSSADVYSAFVGGAEAEIRRAFSIARQSQPCILFMDEMDTLVANRGAGGGSDISVESRVLATLLNEMDGIDGPDSGIVVVGTSNRIDAIDAALLRKGRLNQLVEMKNPGRDEAVALLRYFAEKYKLSASVRSSLLNDLDSHFSPAAFVVPAPLNGAELRRRCQEAAMDCLRDTIAAMPGNNSIIVSYSSDNDNSNIPERTTHEPTKSSNILL